MLFGEFQGVRFFRGFHKGEGFEKRAKFWGLEWGSPLLYEKVVGQGSNSWPWILFIWGGGISISVIF